MDASESELDYLLGEKDEFEAPLGIRTFELYHELERLETKPNFDYARQLIDQWLTTIRHRRYDLRLDFGSNDQIRARLIACNTCGWKMYRDFEQVECHLAFADDIPPDGVIGHNGVALYYVESGNESRWNDHFETCGGSLAERFLSRVWQERGGLRSQIMANGFMCRCCGMGQFRDLADIERLIANMSNPNGEVPSIGTLMGWYQENWSYHGLTRDCCETLRQIGHNWKQEGF